ncbi:MAG TPA: sporulation protein YqfD [Desulfobacteria bacterium]|nr:sporulation protein YqfD [Desulfobacteria bacterium]
MLSRLWSFISGYLTLTVEGKGLERLINMAVSRGLYIWDVKWIEPGKATVKIRLNGIKALRHMARRSKCRFHIAEKGGLPYGVSLFRKRKMLLGGAILSIILIYMMSSVVWFVEVKGNKKLPSEKILRTAEEAGLAMGTLKMGLDKDRIEKYMRNEIPEAAWVGVSITGTKAVIEVAEKIILPVPDSSPANVVAKKDGLVQDLLVLTGKAAVSEGATVKKGDLLISGIIAPEIKPEEAKQDSSQPEQPQTIKFVRAKGIVRAKVWYEGYGEALLIDQGTRRTGRKTEVLSVRLPGKEIVIRGPKALSYKDFVKIEKVKTLPAWRNLRIPVELVTTNYYEVHGYRDIIGMSDAKKIARQRAFAAARASLPAEAKIVGEVTEEIPARGTGVIRVKVLIEALEDISQVEPLKP